MTRTTSNQQQRPATTRRTTTTRRSRVPTESSPRSTTTPACPMHLWRSRTLPPTSSLRSRWSRVRTSAAKVPATRPPSTPWQTTRPPSTTQSRRLPTSSSSPDLDDADDAEPDDAEPELIEATGHEADSSEDQALGLPDMWATPTDWGAAWDAPADAAAEDEPASTATPFTTGGAEPFGTFHTTASASRGTYDGSKRTSLFSAGAAAASGGQSALPTIGADLDTEMPYSPGQPPPPAEPVVKATPRSVRRPPRRRRVVGSASCRSCSDCCWLERSRTRSSPTCPTTTATGRRARPPSPRRPSHPRLSHPPRPCSMPPSATFTSTPLGDGWTQVASVDGGVRLQLPSEPKVAAAAGTGGLVSLTAGSKVADGSS